MAAPALVATASVLCPHGGNVQPVLLDPRVRFGGAPIVLPGQHPITGCAFVIAGQPHPCTHVVWGGTSVRVSASGTPLIVNPAAGMCFAADGLPQGAPVVASPGQVSVVAD